MLLATQLSEGNHGNWRGEYCLFSYFITFAEFLSFFFFLRLDNPLNQICHRLQTTSLIWLPALRSFCPGSWGSQTFGTRKCSILFQAFRRTIVHQRKSCSLLGQPFNSSLSSSIFQAFRVAFLSPWDRQLVYLRIFHHKPVESVMYTLTGSLFESLWNCFFGSDPFLFNRSW